MDDLKLIKKHYGEKMMHFCRDTFPTILEKEGKLFEIISRRFADNRFLYDDIINNNYTEYFKELIYSEFDEKQEIEEETVKTPQELLDEAGYILYECKTEADIQKFRKYYKENEELCTFRGGRLDNCHVFFAVKKNADEIKREDFIGKEERQDEYGTSVISIQFSRGNTNTLSIKNRYNHTVKNPDATFSNNLENIIKGLTASFTKHYNLNINQSKEKKIMPGYVLASDEKFYKYNLEINNTYYCPNNIIIEYFKPKQLDQSRYILFDHYVLDMKEKDIHPYKDKACSESFTRSIETIKSIEVLNNKKENTKEIIINDDIVITLNDKNELIRYRNHNLTSIGSYYLAYNRNLEEIDIPCVESIGRHFLMNNRRLKKINLPLVKRIGDGFLYENRILNEINIPKVETIDSDFLHENSELKEIDLPMCKEIDNSFLVKNKNLKNINLPNVEELGSCFLEYNECLEELDLPNVRVVGKIFLFANKILRKINLPNLRKVTPCFLYHNKGIEELDLPNVCRIADDFLSQNEIIKRINIPKTARLGRNALHMAKHIEELYIPEATEISDSVLTDNVDLTRLYAPNVQIIGSNFLYYNNKLNELILPNAKIIYYGMLRCNKVLKRIELPKIETMSSTHVYNKFILLELKKILLRLPKAIAKDAIQLVKRG